MDTGEDFNEGGFAGAVFAHERVNLARTEGELDAAQHLHAAKCFADLAHFEEGRS
jgi:hypothetical protein